MKLQDWLLCAGFAVALPSGQMLFKFAAIYHERHQEPMLLRLLQNYPLWGAFAWYGVTALFWFYILTRIPLSQAYPIVILGGALVPVFAWAFFREPLSLTLLLGYALMLIGLALVQRAIS